MRPEPPRHERLERALQAHLSRPIALSMVPLGGGSIHHAVRIDAGGERFFAKWSDRQLPGLFAAEAVGLNAIRAATPLRVPTPIAFDDTPGAGFLLLPYLEPAAPGPAYDETFGRGIAALHGKTADTYGFDNDGYCGATPQPNPRVASFTTFFGEHRLGYQLTLARLSTPDRAAVERVIAKLDTLIPPAPPALIHGDLWSGNALSTDAGPALIDPAAHFSHPEAELGMMHLFGGFHARVFAAYDEVRSLEPGWRDRLDLFALYHVLNHATLFGGAYGAQAGAIARRYA